MIRHILAISILLLSATASYSQSLFDRSTAKQGPAFKTGGFIRAGFYTSLNDNDKIIMPTAFTDLALKLNAGDGSRFRAYADLRTRLGTEFNMNATSVWLKEGWVSFYGKEFNLSAGKQIIKWGRADMFNPTSRLNPRDDLYRSPDREDIDIGNILTSLKIFPNEHFSLEGVMAPVYTPSVLPTHLIDIPSAIKIEENGGVIAGKEYTSWAARSDLNLRGFDAGISWFNGINPMPGIGFESFELINQTQQPEPVIRLRTIPYRINMVGFDGDAVLSNSTIRWEAAYTRPAEEDQAAIAIPLPELNWVAGIDHSFGGIRIGIEYWGKKVFDFTETVASPSFPTKAELAMLAQLTEQEITMFITQQLGAFNRLYNYQAEEYYNTFGMTIKRDEAFGRFDPELVLTWNQTTGEITALPTLRIKPADGITLSIGGEYWQGPEDSLYDLIHRPLNSLFFSLRADF